MSGSKLASFLGRPVVVATAAVVLAGVPITVIGLQARNDGYTPTAAATQSHAPSPTSTVSKRAASASPSPTQSVAPVQSPTVSPTLPAPPSGGTPITWVQANVKDGMAAKPTAADVATVYAEKPDFISFNEVEWRGDAVLDPDPEQYGIWRTEGQYTGETPILWNSAKWSEVAEGTVMLSHVTTVPKGKRTEWGMRYANWVTVVNAYGQKVSAVSAHLAPANPAYGNLIPRELNRLGALVAQLKAQGPVLVGGDFNTNYDTTAYPAYPRAQLTDLGLTPTYDILGQKLPTGDEYGATIDYLFLHDPTDFDVVDQHVDELNSDHKAVITHLRLLTPGWGSAGRAFARGRTGGAGVQKLTLSVIKNAPSGATLRLATRTITGTAVLHNLQAAHRRGVVIRVLVGDARATSAERALRRLLGNDVADASCFVRRTRAFSGAGHLPPTVLLADRSGATSTVKLRVNRPLVPSELRDGIAQVTTGRTAYANFLDDFHAALTR